MDQEVLSIVPDTDYVPTIEATSNDYRPVPQPPSAPGAAASIYLRGTQTITVPGQIAQIRLQLKNAGSLAIEWAGVMITIDDPVKVNFPPPIFMKFDGTLYQGLHFIMNPPPMIDDTHSMYKETRWPGKLLYTGSRWTEAWPAGEIYNWDAIIVGRRDTFVHFEALAYLSDGSYIMTEPENETSLWIQGRDESSARAASLGTGQVIEVLHEGAVLAPSEVPRSLQEARAARK